MVPFLTALALGYLLGSIPWAYVITKGVKRVDIRQQGSGNVGASNVFRVVGKKWGLLVLCLDVLKGSLAVSVIAPLFYAREPLFSELLYAFLVGLAAIAGHNWTVFLNFRGGKGVATSLGVSLAVLPGAALASLGVWITVLIPFGYISVASMAAALSFPVWMTLFYRSMSGFPLLLVLSLVLSLLIVYMHRSNIQRLRQGTEKKVWQRD
jgi:glycerol-3-phosphate acyltransferase PlsY